MIFILFLKSTTGHGAAGERGGGSAKIADKTGNNDSSLILDNAANVVTPFRI